MDVEDITARLALEDRCVERMSTCVRLRWPMTLGCVGSVGSGGTSGDSRGGPASTPQQTHGSRARRSTETSSSRESLMAMRANRGPSLSQRTANRPIEARATGAFLAAAPSDWEPSLTPAGFSFQRQLVLVLEGRGRLRSVELMC